MWKSASVPTLDSQHDLQRQDLMIVEKPHQLTWKQGQRKLVDLMLKWMLFMAYIENNLQTKDERQSLGTS